MSERQSRETPGLLVPLGPAFVWFLLLVCLWMLRVASSLGVFSKIPSYHAVASCGLLLLFCPFQSSPSSSRGEISISQTVKHINNHRCGNQLAGRMLDWDALLYCNGPIWGAIWNAYSFTVLFCQELFIMRTILDLKKRKEKKKKMRWCRQPNGAATVSITAV